MINKEEFINIIKGVERHIRFLDALDRVAREYGEEYTEFANLSCADLAIRALNYAVDEKEGCDDISYFCWELDFGRDWYEGCVLDKDGNDIPLKTPEDLWNLITLNREIKDD